MWLDCLSIRGGSGRPPEPQYGNSFGYGHFRNSYVLCPEITIMFIWSDLLRSTSLSASPVISALGTHPVVNPHPVVGLCIEFCID